MGKKILVLCMVIALLVLLPVFSYAAESDFASYTDVTSSFPKYSSNTSGYSKLLIGAESSSGAVQGASYSSSYDYQFIFDSSLNPSNNPALVLYPTTISYYEESPWKGEYSKDGSTYTVTFYKEDCTFTGTKVLYFAFPYKLYSAPSNLKVLRGTLKSEPEPHSITVLDNGYGSVSSDVTSAIEGTTVSLTATPNTGYQFDRWEVVSNNVSISNNKFVMPDEPVTVQAIFTPIQYSISVSSQGNGSVSSSASTATAGTTVTLTATPDDGYVFSEWQVLQGNIDIVNNQFIMPSSDVSVKAVFVPDGAHSVTVQNDGFGTGSANPVRAQAGDRITLSAVPALGYEFDKWQVISGSVNISNNQFIMPDSDVVVKALFKPIVYTITLNQSPNGTATVSQQTGIIGDVITLTATPNEYYTFLYWDVTQGGISVDGNSFIMPASNVVLTPVFVKQSAVSSGYTFNSGVKDDNDITARQGLADINFGDQPAGEYLINIYTYGQNYGVSYDIGVGSDTTTTRKLPYTQSGGVTTALYTHSGGQMVLDLNFTYYKSVLNSPAVWYAFFDEGTASLSTSITSSGNYVFNIIDVVATPTGLANSEDYGIYGSIVSFLKSQFNDIKSFLTEQIGRIAGDEEAESDVSKAEEELNKEVEDLNNLGGQLEEQQTSLETQFESDFKVSDDITAQTSTFQGIYSGIFSSFGIFSIFIWLPVVLAVIKKLLRL